MQSIAVVYFSGTGNTEYVAKNMIKIIKEHNIHVDLINIEKGIVSFKDYDAVIIGGPVYVERYPEILLKYIENAMKHYKGKCMLFTTQAVDKPTMAFQHAINRLDFLNITYCLFVPMPNNFYNFMFEKTSKEESEKRVEKSYDICKVAVDDFLNGKTQFFEFSKTTVNMINWVYNLYYSHFTKFITKRINIDKDKCINCRLCEKRCPISSIRLRDGAVFSDKCMLCQRCMSGCPKGAFMYKDKIYNQYKLKLYQNN